MQHCGCPTTRCLRSRPCWPPASRAWVEQLVRFTLDTLRDPQARDDLMSMARTGVSAGQAVTGLQQFIEIGVVDRVAGTIGVPDARMRTSLITSYLMGVAIMRYGVRLEPLASASEEEVIRMVAPVIQDLLDPRRPIPGSARDRARAAGKNAKAAQTGIRRRTFDPDPAATRAAKARAEAQAAARAQAQAKRAASRSAAKTASRSTARPAASPAARRAAEPTVKPDASSTAPPESPAMPDAAATPDANANAEGRARRGREVPGDLAAASHPGSARADVGEGAADPADPVEPTATGTTAAKPGSARKAATTSPPARRRATPTEQERTSPASDPRAGSRKPPGATSGEADSAAAPDHAQEPPGAVPASDD